MFEFFPTKLNKDLSIVLGIIPKTTFNNVSIGVTDERIEYRLSNHKVAIPYRIYFVEPSDDEISLLNDLQKQILYCLYTRSCNGYLREKYIRKLLNSNFEEWCFPYIVKLCDEYVIEILHIIYNSLNERDTEDIKVFCRNNKSIMRRSYSRMTSYWNEFYRKEMYNFHKYIGRKLFKDCLGYNRTFENSNDC